eukprot:Skav220529  [mRNA]  locus=scaffold6435:55230:57906:- [translate_table: standard]
MPGRAGDAEAVCKSGSAARHTYDVGYSKWDAFDVEAALHEVDRCDGHCRPPRSPVDVMALAEEEAKRAMDRNADPKELLDAAISRLQTQEVQELEPAKEDKKATVAVDSQGDAAEGADSAQDLSNICLANAGDTTGHQLAAEYQKWEDFDEDMEGLDDDLDGGYGGVDSNGLDLNALTGPAEEVKQIQAHWRREAVKMAKSHRRDVRPGGQGKPQAKEVSSKVEKCKVALEPTASTRPVVQERPCVVAPAAGRDDNYAKWKKFDADAALLELDNEDTTEDRPESIMANLRACSYRKFALPTPPTKSDLSPHFRTYAHMSIHILRQEGKTMRLSAGQGSAMLNCEGYTKDREEYDLDQDIERNMGGWALQGLKKIIAQNFKDASCLKAEGNELMRSGQVAVAIEKYREGLDTLYLAREASVLMSPSLAAKQSSLVADLYKNLAAAQLKSSDFEAALSSANEALKACTGVVIQKSDGENFEGMAWHGMACNGMAWNGCS